MFYIIVCNGLQQSTVAIILNVSLWFSGKCSMFNYINQYISHWCTISKKVRNVHLLMRNQLSVVGSQRQEWSRVNISAEPVLISDHSIWGLTSVQILYWYLSTPSGGVTSVQNLYWSLTTPSGGLTSVQNLYWSLTTPSGGLTSVHLED